MPVRRHVLVAAGLLGLTLLILKDVLFLGGAFYERDILSVYAPMAEAFVKSIAEGALPLRDPTTAFGQPLLGNPDAQILYPTTWLNLLMVPERFYPIFVLVHFVLGATGAAALAWRFGRSMLGSFFAGAFWLVSGPFQSFLNVWHHLAGAAWMPWVLTAFDRLLETPDRRRTFILAAAFGVQILAGSADMCAMTMSLAILRLVCEGRAVSRTQILSQLRMALVSLAIAVSLGAGVWLTVADVSRSSARASMREDIRTYWSVNPALAPEFILPLRVADQDLNSETRNLLFDGPLPFVRSLFLGPLTLPLFFGALFSSSIPAKYRAFCGLGALASVLVSFGRHAPIYELLITIAPVLKIFRYPSKVLIPLSLLLSVLAGVGVARLVGERERRVGRAVTLLLLVLHLGLVGRIPELLPHFTMTTDPLFQVLHAALMQAHFLLSTVSLLFLAVALAAPRPRAMVLAAFTGLVMTMVIHSGFSGAVAQSVLRFRPDHVATVRTKEPTRLYVEDYIHFPERSRRFLERGSPYEGMKDDDLPPELGFIVGVRTTLVPPVAGAWGIEYAWDMDLRGLFDGILRDITVALRDLDGDPAFLRLLQIANVSYVVSLHTSTYAQLQLEHAIETRLRGPLYVFKVPGFLPRAYATSGVRVVEGKGLVAVINALIHPDFTPATEVILDGGIARAASPTFQSTVRIASRRSDRIALDVVLNEPGTVVLVEGFLPGWHATIDDVAVPVRRANALFVAVPAPAGEHRVVFTYRPWTAVIGVSLTVLTALALLISLARRQGEEGRET